MGLALQGLLADADRAVAAAETLKAQIREVAKEGQAFLFGPEDKTVKIGVLKITRSDENPSPPLIPEELRKRIPDDLFHEVITIKTADIDLRAWRRAVEEERVTDDDLRKSLGEPPKPRAWSVGLA